MRSDVVISHAQLIHPDMRTTRRARLCPVFTITHQDVSSFTDHTQCGLTTASAHSADWRRYILLLLLYYWQSTD